MNDNLKMIFSFKYDKWNKIILLIITIITFIVYPFLYFQNLNIISFDNATYMLGVNSYFQNGTPYIRGFVYLDYFCYLFPYFLMPFYINFTIRLITNMIICLVFFQIQRKNKLDINLNYWIYANYIFMYGDVIQLNFNSLIPLIFYIYYRYRDEQKWVALLLVFCFFKINSIAIFSVLMVLDLIFKRKLKYILKNIVYLIPVIIIVGISFIHSIEIGFFEAQNSGGYSFSNILLALQPQHFFSYSIILYVFIDKIKNWQQINLSKKFKFMIEDKRVKIFWVCYVVILACYSVLLLSII